MIRTIAEVQVCIDGQGVCFVVGGPRHDFAGDKAQQMNMASLLANTARDLGAKLNQDPDDYGVTASVQKILATEIKKEE